MNNPPSTVTATAYAIVRGRRYTPTGPVTDATLRSVRQSRPDYVERNEIVMRLALTIERDAFEFPTATAHIVAQELVPVLQVVEPEDDDDEQEA
jgi:hypothetical protein